MRTTLLITGLAGFLVLGALPATAAGPGHEAPGANGSGGYIVSDGNNDWRYDNNSPYGPRYGQASPDRDWQSRDDSNSGAWRSDNRWRDGSGNGNPAWNGPWQDRHDAIFPGQGWRFGNHDQHDNRRQMSDNDIRHRLTQQNYRDFNHGNFNNGYYIVNATDYRGRDVRLTVDAFSGYLINVQRRDR